jgi:hypothetical protein
VLEETLEMVFFAPEWKVEPEEDYQERWSMSFTVVLHPRMGAVPKKATGAQKPKTPPSQ